jgi:hypothetical protein
MLTFIPATDVTTRVPSMAIPLHRPTHEAAVPMNAINELRPKSLSGLSLEGPRVGRTYNEQTFRYFLSLEEKRSERSGRPFLLLLVDLKEEPGKSACLEPRMASTLFTALSPCVRETDFIGWYREDHVAGAVLTHVGDAAEMDIPALIVRRVGEALRGGTVPPYVAKRLRVRVDRRPPAMDRS